MTTVPSASKRKDHDLIPSIDLLSFSGSFDRPRSRIRAYEMAAERVASRIEDFIAKKFENIIEFGNEEHVEYDELSGIHDDEESLYSNGVSFDVSVRRDPSSVQGSPPKVLVGFQDQDGSFEGTESWRPPLRQRRLARYLQRYRAKARGLNSFGANSPSSHQDEPVHVIPGQNNKLKVVPIDVEADNRECISPPYSGRVSEGNVKEEWARDFTSCSGASSDMLPGNVEIEQHTYQSQQKPSPRRFGLPMNCPSSKNDAEQDETNSLSGRNEIDEKATFHETSISLTGTLIAPEDGAVEAIHEMSEINNPTQQPALATIVSYGVSSDNDPGASPQTTEKNDYISLEQDISVELSAPITDQYEGEANDKLIIDNTNNSNVDAAVNHRISEKREESEKSSSDSENNNSLSSFESGKNDSNKKRGVFEDPALREVQSVKERIRSMQSCFRDNMTGKCVIGEEEIELLRQRSLAKITLSNSKKTSFGNGEHHHIHRKEEVQQATHVRFAKQVYTQQLGDKRTNGGLHVKSGTQSVAGKASLTTEKKSHTNILQLSEKQFMFSKSHPLQRPTMEKKNQPIKCAIKKCDLMEQNEPPNENMTPPHVTSPKQVTPKNNGNEFSETLCRQPELHAEHSITDNGVEKKIRPLMPSLIGNLFRKKNLELVSMETQDATDSVLPKHHRHRLPALLPKLRFRRKAIANK